MISVLFKGSVECPQVQDKTEALCLGRNPSVVTASLVVLGVHESLSPWSHRWVVPAGPTISIQEAEFP